MTQGLICLTGLMNYQTTQTSGWNQIELVDSQLVGTFTNYSLLNYSLKLTCQNIYVLRVNTDHWLGEKNFSPSTMHPRIVFFTVMVVRGVRSLVS